MAYPFSASSIERVRACPASAVLPAVYATSEDAERGTGLHLYAKRRLKGWGRERALALVDPAYRGTAQLFEPSRVSGCYAPVRCEVSYAVNAVTGEARELGVDLERGYAPFLREHEIPGTNDVEGKDALGTELTEDWKFGFERVTAAPENLQVMFAAYARWRLTDAPEVKGRLSYVGPTGDCKVDEATFSAFHLESFFDILSETYAAVRRAKAAYSAGENLPVSPGKHCKYCPALASCGAHIGLAKELVPELERIQSAIRQLTPEGAGHAWATMDKAQAILDHVRAGLETYVRQQVALHGEVPLPDGKKKVTEISFFRASFDRDAALALLRDLGADDAMIAALYRDTPVSQIRVVNRGKR